MTAPDLPAELTAVLNAKLQGLSRSDGAARAALISRTCRDEGSAAAQKRRQRAVKQNKASFGDVRARYSGNPSFRRLPATRSSVGLEKTIACLNFETVRSG